jgi:hypothetical protein
VTGRGQRGSGDARLQEHAAIVARLLRDWPDAVAEFSPPGVSRRADLFVDGTAVECQVGPIKGAAAAGRCRDYARVGIDCLWIWGGRRLPRPFPYPRRQPPPTPLSYWETVPEPPGVAEFLYTQVSPTLLAARSSSLRGVFVALGPPDALRFEEWWIGEPGCFAGPRLRPVWRQLVASCDELVPRPVPWESGALRRRCLD